MEGIAAFGIAAFGIAAFGIAACGIASAGGVFINLTGAIGVIECVSWNPSSAKRL